MSKHFFGVLHYLVLSPGCYCWLQCCRYVGTEVVWRVGVWLIVTGRWMICEEGFIGDVTHLRLAVEGESASRAATPSKRRTLRRRLSGHGLHP